MATVETIVACFPEVPVVSGNEELSKEFCVKFGKLYAKERASYRSIYDEWDGGPGYPTSLSNGKEALGWLRWFKERLQEEGALALNRWLELICDHEEEGPKNFWASSVLLEIALLCLEELGVQDPWEYRHAYFSMWDNEEVVEEDCWDKYAIYDLIYNN